MKKKLSKKRNKSKSSNTNRIDLTKWSASIYFIWIFCVDICQHTHTKEENIQIKLMHACIVCLFQYPNGHPLSIAGRQRLEMYKHGIEWFKVILLSLNEYIYSICISNVVNHWFLCPQQDKNVQRFLFLFLRFVFVVLLHDGTQFGAHTQLLWITYVQNIFNIYREKKT